MIHLLPCLEIWKVVFVLCGTVCTYAPITGMSMQSSWNIGPLTWVCVFTFWIIPLYFAFPPVCVCRLSRQQHGFVEDRQCWRESNLAHVLSLCSGIRCEETAGGQKVWESPESPSTQCEPFQKGTVIDKTKLKLLSCWTLNSNVKCDFPRILDVSEMAIVHLKCYWYLICSGHAFALILLLVSFFIILYTRSVWELLEWFYSLFTSF